MTPHSGPSARPSLWERRERRFISQARLAGPANSSRATMSAAEQGEQVRQAAPGRLAQAPKVEKSLLVSGVPIVAPVEVLNYA